MTHAQQMVQTNPSQAPVDESTLVKCIEACFDCAQACTACADACIGEGDIQMLARCIRLDLDCADVCDATGRILSRQTATEPQMLRSILQACGEACRLCGRSASNTPITMSTAGCAWRSAAAARAPATTSHPRWELRVNGREHRVRPAGYPLYGFRDGLGGLLRPNLDPGLPR